MGNLPLPLASFTAGLFSFLSPCVLPLVPGYMSLISGVGIEELQQQDSKLMRKVMLNSLAFILGFSIVFIILGAIATSIGQLFAVYKPKIAIFAGVVIIIFGLHLTGIFKIRALYSDKRLHSVKGGKSPLGAFVIGFAFAFGWTPCLGPIISTILFMAGSTDQVGKGVLLLWVYSLGLAVPFLATSLLLDRFLSFYGRFRKHLHKLEVASGALLIVFGALILAGRFTILSGYLGFLNRFTW